MNREPCPYDHSGKYNGVWVLGHEGQVEEVRTANGVVVHKLRCLGCGNLSGAVPKGVAEAWGLDKLAHIHRDNTAEVECIVATCTSTHIEYHHFAPRNTFGKEADDWPILPVCREHHAEWHTRMDGYRWHRKRTA